MNVIQQAILLALAPTFAPCPPTSKDDPIKVVVLVILGTDKNKDVNERLKEIAPELRKKDDSLTGFELKTTLIHSLKMGESKQLDLIGNNKMKVTINEKTDDAGHVTITIKPPKLDDITYGCTCGMYFPILTNCYTADNKRIIIAVMAKPCKKK
jgi:hypothetical protein